MDRARACQGIVEMLNEIIGIFGSPRTDVVWSGYDTVKDAIFDLADHIDRLTNGDLSRRMDLELLFAPTGDLGEIALSSGWSDRYLDLAERFDALCEGLGQE